MAKLVLDTGLVTYPIEDTDGNHLADITFNPTDTDFIERLYSAFDALDKKQESYNTDLKKLGSTSEVFAFIHQRDAEMREIIDGVFGAPVCASLFTTNIYAMAGGLPVWANFLMSIIDEVDAAMAKEQQAMQPRIDKYTAKYAKYKR